MKKPSKFELWNIVESHGLEVRDFEHAILEASEQSIEYSTPMYFTLTNEGALIYSLTFYRGLLDFVKYGK